MAPRRKKGANTKGKVIAEFSLGDLVLAKVKGFPAWPAKDYQISRPEQWKQIPDPKKHFVVFFGTNEIGFVAPADIQPFTIVLKEKLQAKYKKGTFGCFAQALHEICEAFEESEPKESGSLGNDMVSNPDRSYLNGVEANVLEHNVGDNGEAVGNASSCGSSLERCSNMKEGAASKNKFYPGELGFSKERILKCSLATNHSDDQTNDGKKADLDVCNERIQSERTSASPYGCDCDNSSADLINCKRIPPKQRSSTDGHGSMGLHSERKRKFDDVHDRVRSGGHQKDGVLHTTSSGKSDKHPSGYRVNKVMKDKKPDDIIKISQEDSFPTSKVYGEALPPKEKNSSHIRSEKNPVGISERSDSSKRKKPIDLVNLSNKHSSLKNEKRDSVTRRVHDGGLEKNSENKRSICTKGEEQFHSKPSKCSVPSDVPLDEEVTPSVKRHRVIVLNAMSGPIKPASDDKRSSISSIQKSDVTKKRRAIRLYGDDDEDDIPKTPVHGSSARKLNSSSSISESLQTSVQIQGNCLIGQAIKGTSKSGEAFAKLSDPNAKFCSDSSSASLPETLDKSDKVHSPNQLELDTNKQLPVSSNPEFVSPSKLSPCIILAADKILGEQSITKHQLKVSEIAYHSKDQSISFKRLHLGSAGSNYSPTQVAPKKNRQLSSGEKPKVTPKSQVEIDSAVSGRVENVMKDRGGSLEDSKMDSELSMKHLIAAAQAKRKQAQMQNLLQSNFVFDFGNTESPSVEHQFISGGNNLVQVGLREIHSRTSFASPSGLASEGVSQNQGIEEHNDNRPKLGHQGDKGSLSGGTEAAVARDAFEGMIETLTRTKESIGRATRLAVECAKYGIADEVVDLLIRKLESESSFHRKVDIFFLVDSITQCSHNQKGIAGASYVPAVHAALSRLLGAAAPAGASARENRRQCLKVLRLWLERKILPESVLRHHMDSIRASDDDIIHEFSFKRPLRAERSVDDPIREMEGMLVDEYGSNATFQLSGFFPSHGFVIDEEDEEDVLGTPCVGVSVELAETLREPEACVVTLSDKHRHILEDVDVELEMEDVSGHQEDEIAVSTSWSSEVFEHEQSAEREKNHAAYIEADSMTPIGSPPLPLEPQTPQPPLPESPPPPLPPSCPPSPPPPPPPPSPPVHPPFPPQLSFPSQVSSKHPMPEGFCSMPEIQIGQMTGNAPEQSSSFITAFSQGPFHPIPSHNIPTPSNHFPYNKPAVQQHVEHPNPHSYSSPSIADNRMRFVADDPCALMNGGRNPSRLTTLYGAEGYYRPPTERPQSNNMGFQYSSPNMVVQAGVPIHGHGNGHILQSRPDMSALNCWRPA